MSKNQYIGISKLKYEKFDCSTISTPAALDSFSVNIVNLGSSGIWSCSRSRLFGSDSIDMREDLISLSDIINNSKKSKQIVIIPQNVRISHLDSFSRTEYDELKNHIEFFCVCLQKYMFMPAVIGLGFEPNKTCIAGRTISSDFYFKHSNNIITSALESDKPTTIKIKENLFFTTLDLKSEADVIDFMKTIGFYEESSDYPQWLNDIEFNDDSFLKEKNIELKAKIDCFNKEIDSNNNKLKDNLRIKSILTETGDNLVSIVFKIITEMLDIDLSDFEDEKKEDFLFKIDGVTFIGEIKGINEGIRNTFISQIDNHKSLYEDKLQDENLPSETIKKILIINDQRKKPIKDRDPIHQNQIEKAKKEDVLIIRGIDLLNIYELFKQNKIKREEIFEILKNQKGPINIEPFKNNQHL